MITTYTAAITLILVMDPLGNIPVFISVLNTVEPNRRSFIILRECIIAFLLLALFLFAGQYILHSLGITESALSISGGIILFLIALRMIFPTEESTARERHIGEPFIVPLAIPLVAGPSALATLLLLATQAPQQIGTIFLALIIASFVTTMILLFCNPLRKVLGQKGLIAVERLMGMILTTVAVQMFLTGVHHYLQTIK